MSIRTERVAGEVQQAIARLFQQEFTDLSDGMVTVTKVRMAPDLKSGRVYLSILGGEMPGPETLKRIKAAAPQIRYSLAKAINMKFSPELFYYLDDTAEEVSTIEDIFRKIREEAEAKAAKPDAGSENTANENEEKESD
jgi:ribosome-binding factor A